MERNPKFSTMLYKANNNIKNSHLQGILFFKAIIPALKRLIPYRMYNFSSRCMHFYRTHIHPSIHPSIHLSYEHIQLQNFTHTLGQVQKPKFYAQNPYTMSNLFTIMGRAKFLFLFLFNFLKKNSMKFALRLLWSSK